MERGVVIEVCFPMVNSFIPGQEEVTPRHPLRGCWLILLARRTLQHIYEGKDIAIDCGSKYGQPR